MPQGIVNVSVNNLLRSILDWVKTSAGNKFHRPRGYGPRRTVKKNKRAVVLEFRSETVLFKSYAPAKLCITLPLMQFKKNMGDSC